MPRDTRMSRMLHLLIHMDRHMNKATSDTISKMLGSHPVAVRRMMGGLKDKGVLTAEKGHNGGWTLNRDLAGITLLEVYEAVGEPAFFNIGPQSEHPSCLVEQAVDARMAAALADAEAQLRQSFASVTVADVAADYERKSEQGIVKGDAERACLKQA